MDYINENIIINVFEILNETKCEYVLIKNIGNELPLKLPDGKDIDIVINGNDRERFINNISAEFDIVQHPLGASNGWIFLYGMQEHDFFKLKKTGGENVYLDVSYVLSCKSLMPKTWIPLDKELQDRMWADKCWDSNNNWWILDDETRFVYYMVRCIFDKQVFSERYIKEIENTSIDLPTTKRLLEKVFYKYTNRLMEMLKDRRYDEIRDDYIRFIGY